MTDGTNVFISHIHEDDEKITAMKSLLQERGYNVRDSSINSTRPNEAHNEAYIREEILGPRIKWATVVVVLISPETGGSKWVNWEIEYAQREDRRIVGVWTHGAADTDVPEALDLYADAVVGWQGERIQAAIEGTLNNWETSDGRLRPSRAIAHYSCT